MGHFQQAPSAASKALFAARSLLGELEREGLREACLAPGSRSTPLALALAERRIRTHVITDERSLGFFALGLAKASEAPVLVVCTSGTAAANLLPAVVEASLAGVPLLLFAADRPPELRDCSAPQTIDQVALYGSHARWAVDVPILDVGESAERYYRSLARRALATASAEHAGPVQLNLPLREPFWDDSFSGDARLDLAARLPEQAPASPHGVLCSPSRLDDAATRALAQRLSRAERGLIVCAGQTLPAGDIAALAAALGWPILADPLSGLRYGGHDHNLVVDAYDPLLRDENFRCDNRPDAVLRFGTTPAPRSLQTFLEESRPCDHLLVAASGWPDPFHTSSTVVRSQPAPLCRDLVAALIDQRHCDTTDTRASTTGARSQWTANWLAASRAARTTLDQALDAAALPGSEVFEGAIVRAVAGAVTSHSDRPATLFVGNSMPIRDADAFFGQSDQDLRILANRGASGIDGVISTALGVAATRARATVLVIGDLSFLHDATALAVAARYRIPLVTVVINNDGGGIFSFLPQQGLGAIFEPLFATPHGVDLAAVATALLPGAYDLASDLARLAELLRAAIGRDEPRVIEIRTDRTTNPERCRRLVALAQDAAREAATPAIVSTALAPKPRAS